MLNLPGVFFLTQFDLTKRFLTCLKNPVVPMFAMLTSTVVHVLWCKIFVTQNQMGLQGIALAQNITAFLLFVFVTLYTLIPELSIAVFFFDSTALSSFGPYLKLGLPASGALVA